MYKNLLDFKLSDFDHLQCIYFFFSAHEFRNGTAGKSKMKCKYKFLFLTEKAAKLVKTQKFNHYHTNLIILHKGSYSHFPSRNVFRNL